MRVFTNRLRNLWLPALIIVLTSSGLAAQQRDSAKVAADSVNAVARRNNGPKVTGIITDASTGKAVGGVSISVPGYSATITGDNGKFSVSVPNYSAVLVVTGDGFQTKEIALKGRHDVAASLYEDTFVSLYATAQLPYAIKSKAHIPSAVESLNATVDNWQRASESADTYLQGRVAGLNATRRSGTPGIGANIALRGFTSLYATNQPLYIVDGIMYDNNDYGISLIGGHVANALADVDIKDIDNITVIKDAAAAIYGTRGANGVILITTARAKDQATKIDFSAYGGYNFAPSSLPVMKAGDYRVYLSEILKTGGLSDVQVQALPFMNDDPTNPNYGRYHYDTDWQKQVMDNSFNQNYYIKVTGGDNIATYALSVGYMNNQGITRNTDLNRFQVRFNGDLNLTTKLKGTANLSVVNNQQTLRDQGIAYKTNPTYLALIKAPFLPVQDVSDLGIESPNLADVDIFKTSNPEAIINKMIATNKNYRFLGSIGLTYSFNKSLTLSTIGGITYDKIRENIFIPQRGVVQDTITLATVKNRLGNNVERLFALYNDTKFSYTPKLNSNNSLSSNLGLRFNNNNRESDYGISYNSATDDYRTIGQGQATLRRIGGENGIWRWMNLYGNIDYEYLHRYMLSFNGAIDGSSRFGKSATDALTLNGNKLAVLPSISAGWLISSEPFMANSKIFELLKLRASYGLVGNEDIGNYAARQYYTTQNFLGIQGLVRGNIANPALKWETVTKANIGLDVSLFNERLNLTVDAYDNKTKDMLSFDPVSTVSGFTTAVTNNGSMKTRGVEGTIGARILKKAVKWDISLNLASYKNTVLSVPNGSLLTSYAGGTVITRNGEAANQFYGFKTNGVYATDAEAAASGLKNRREDGNVTSFFGGDVRFVDTNGDGFVDNNDRQVIGNPNPSLTGMLSNMVSWKRWSFDARISFVSGNDIYNFTRRSLESMSTFANQTLDVRNRWRAPGQITDVPRAVPGDPANNSRFSDRWIEDGSYIRLRTVSVTYNLPFKNSAFKYAKVYLTGNNVVTLTKYLGYDPEFSATSSIFTQGIDATYEPQYRTVQLGVRVGL